MTFVFIFGAAVLSLIALAVLAELIFRAYKAVADRFFYESVTRSDYIDKNYHPYLNVWEDWSKPMFHYHPVGLRLFNTDIAIPGRLENNRLGFRCDEFTPPDDDELRIVLLGGSAAWGSGASSNEATIAGQLEKYINDDPALLGPKKRAKCFNLAQVNGFQTQDVLSMAFFAPRIMPDLVVSFSGWNELVANYPMDPELLEKYGVFYIDEMGRWEPPQVFGKRAQLLRESFIGWGRDKSQLLSKLLSPAPSPAPQFDYSVDELQGRLSLCGDLFVRHLKTLNRLSGALNAKHFQVLQPNLYRKPTLAPEEAPVIELYDEIRPAHGGKVIGDFLRTNDIYADIRRAAEKDADAAGPVIDLSDVFQSEERHRFFTLVHMNDEGQRIIAENIYRAIAESPGTG